MIGLRSLPTVPTLAHRPPLGRWTKILAAGGTVALLAIGCLFFAALSAHLGLFATLFAAAILAFGIATQLIELSNLEHRV